MKSKNVIELNGKRYDAKTGAILGAGSAPHVPTVAKPVDGFFRTTRSSTSAKQTTSQPHKITILAAPVAHHQPVTKHPKTHHVAAHAKAHKPETAVTLMRSAVTRPKPSFKQQASVQSSLQHKVPSLIASKKSVYSLDEQRLARAKTTERSPLVAHHSNHSGTHVPVTFAPIAVQPAPEKPENQTAPAPTPTNKPLDMFEHAIANAGHFVDIKSHHAHFKKQSRRHVMSMAAGTLSLLIVAGFVAYQNNPRLQVKVAGAKSGVSASLPNFQAAGFDYNGVKAVNSKLAIGFTGNGGQYQLTQQTTNLSSEDVIQQIGSTDASGMPNYSTLQVGKIPVYRFSNTNASWVANGIWYTLTGTNALTDSQVTAIVKNI